MASFEKREASTYKAHDPSQKLPLKRFEPAIYRFTKIAIPMDLDRLDRHKYNLEKYVKWKNWSKLEVEKNNAERTIKQLKTNIHDMNAIRTQVTEDDLAAFDDKVKHLSDKALDKINSLRKVIDDSEEARDKANDENTNLSPQSSDTDMSPLSSSQTNMFESIAMVTNISTENKAMSPQPLARFDVTLHTFTRITIPTAIERLRMHCQNMEKFYEAKLWDRLHSEQVNAALTVKHLKTNIQDIETVRCQVPRNELVHFDKRVGPSYQHALQSIGSFMKFQEKYRGVVEVNQDTAAEHATVTIADKQVQRQLVIPDETTLHSWDELQTSLVELNELIHDFSHLVYDQQSPVDTITSNIDHAQANIEEGTRELGKAAKLQGVLVPTLGAVVGGVVGGPIGMLAGFKAAAVLTAFGGGILGYSATNYWKHKRENTVDIELEKLVNQDSDDHEKPSL